MNETSNGAPSPLLQDPISPAFRSALRRSPLSQDDQEKALQALRHFYALHSVWENNFSRPQGQNFNPQASRCAQVYLETSTAPTLSGIYMALGLCAASQELAQSLGSALASEDPENAWQSWRDCCASASSMDPALLEPLAVYALDTLRHLHLDARAAPDKKDDFNRAQELAKNLQAGKLLTFVLAALRRIAE